MSSHYVIGLINRNFSLNPNWSQKILHKLTKKKSKKKSVIYLCVQNPKYFTHHCLKDLSVTRLILVLTA